MVAHKLAELVGPLNHIFDPVHLAHVLELEVATVGHTWAA
jgi:hypothetical protein